ncbi:MAG: Glu/Leu/Phe/Val dehydrogenase dimerization domain-containing protein [Terricaulis sp.]
MQDQTPEESEEESARNQPTPKASTPSTRIPATSSVAPRSNAPPRLGPHPEADAFDSHEEIQAVCDAKTGLNAIIAVHSTVRGPAIGGCRMKAYPSWGAALADVLRLSRGMSFKNAMIDLQMGGAKAVIIADPNAPNKPALLEAFAKRVEAMAGRYWTAEDANISPDDIAIMARSTQYVVGGDMGDHASGNPAPVTARGVVDGMRVCAAEKGLDPDLKGVRVAILGVGGVGALVARMVADAGALVTVADLKEARAQEVAVAVNGRAVDVETLWGEPTDIFSPNTLGAVIGESEARALDAKIVAGAENNPLRTDADGDILHERGILYAPDYVINAGGLVSCYAEVVARRNLESLDRAWMDAQVARIGPNLRAVIENAKADGTATHRVADAEAKHRIGRSA